MVTVASCGLLLASRASLGQSGLPSACGNTEGRGSTTVLLVSTNMDTLASQSALLRAALHGNRAVGIYSASDSSALRAAQRMQDLVGGSLQPYDRLRMTAEGFAKTLVENAVAANVGKVVVVVLGPDLRQPFIQAASALAAPADDPAGTMGSTGDALVLRIDDHGSRWTRAAEEALGTDRGSHPASGDPCHP